MTAGAPARRPRRLLPRRERPTQRVALGLGILSLLLGTVLSILNGNNQLKIAGVIIIVVVLSSLILSMTGMLIELGVTAGCLALVFWAHGLNESTLSMSGFVMVVVTGLVGVLQARRRDGLGLKEVSAETVISLIRERQQVQARLPVVPEGWSVEIQQRSADRAAISGDFVSNRLITRGGSRVLHLAVVDVSGSGMTAGPRALLLSGAIGGLLGSVQPDDFLPAANDYLARQQWSLGFASAVYLRLDLGTGEYEVRVAGHPPVLHHRPEARPTWRVSTAAGTVLGVIPQLTTHPDHAVLAPGEALLLYTDGVVEDRTRDLDSGLQRLRESFELVAAQDRWGDAGRYLIERVPSEARDDRTLVIIRRLPVTVPVEPGGDEPAASAGDVPAADEPAATSA